MADPNTPNDYYTSAQQQNDAVKASLLSAIAQHGSQAKAAMDQAAQAIQAQKQQALAAAIAESQQRGAGQALQDQNAATISSGYDRQLADLTSASASRQASNQSQQAQAGSYFDQANAALPVLRTRSNMQAATIAEGLANRLAASKASQDQATASGNRQAAMFEAQLQDRHAQQIAAQQAAQQAAEDKATQQAQQQQIAQLQLQTAQANADKASTGAQAAATKQAAPPKPPTVPQLLANSVGDKATFNSYVDQQKAAQPKIAQLPSLGAILSSAQAELTGRQIGLPAGVGQAIYAQHQQATAATQKQATASQLQQDQQATFDPVKTSNKTGLTAQTVRTVHASQNYADAAASATSALNVGKNPDGTNYTQAQLRTDLAAHFGQDPAVIKIIMAEYGPLFPTKAK